MSKHRTKGCLLVCILTIVLMTTTVQAVNEVSYIKGSGIIKYEKADWDTKPVDPENPEDEVEPGGEIVSSKGPLRFDMLPTINFGSQLLSQENQKYYAFAQLFKSNTPARGNYIQITDNRGTLAGWQLSVKQEHQFKNNTTKHKELNGAILSFDKQWANSTLDSKYKPTIVKDAIKIEQMGTTYPIAIAEKGKGSGTWTIEFGSSGTVDGVEKTLTAMLNADGKSLTDSAVGNKPMYKNQAITLFVPGKTLKDPVKYTTVLTWIIAELD